MINHKTATPAEEILAHELRPLIFLFKEKLLAPVGVEGAIEVSFIVKTPIDTVVIIVEPNILHASNVKTTATDTLIKEYLEKRGASCRVIRVMTEQIYDEKSTQRFVKEKIWDKSLR